MFRRNVRMYCHRHEYALQCQNTNEHHLYHSFNHTEVVDYNINWTVYQKQLFIYRFIHCTQRYLFRKVIHSIYVWSTENPYFLNLLIWVFGVFLSLQTLYCCHELSKNVQIYAWTTLQIVLLVLVNTIIQAVI